MAREIDPLTGNGRKAGEDYTYKGAPDWTPESPEPPPRNVLSGDFMRWAVNRITALEEENARLRRRSFLG